MPRIILWAVMVAGTIGLLCEESSADPLLTKRQIAKAAQRIDACLAKQLSVPPGQGDRRKCIGLIKGECEDQISAGGEAAHATCSDNETAAWDVLLNQTWKKFPAGLSSERFAALKDVQRQWLSYRKAKCTFLNDIEQPGAWGLMLEADCVMDDTARRALELQDILMDPTLGAAER